ncbi:glycoside hydrolase family 130 protein [Caldicoprobacter faecalis]|uniref:Beta-1,4-mannooligosaccharide/beta-1,4-mannosyl-N-acetylglucosamine phosphorylase n=1 Tax=Caldicoprobacter faecalis TaxID=937334 RepID=A0A1I5X8M2_9FIRM|nr:glycoside hydrolase family 130 protein [Caldicoprobacter faecalis]SFQ28329.1 beta-1,4-mannooligosaccharide/beta-1,4-mannosyl-N-acetylglucosamine phosphorylase [Caldicoprobacter faecalis]
MSNQLTPILKSSPVIKRYENNPILSYKDVPYKAALIFNAGVTKYQGKYVMVFRNDYGSIEEQRLEGTNLGLAFSDDGIHWEVKDKPCFELKDDEILRAYDPRLTVIDGKVYMCFAVDTKHGIRGGIAVTEDFEKFDILSMTVPDNRNMVLFPEKIGGKYVRLERPFPVYGRGGKDRFDIWISDSPDLVYWGNSKLLLGVEDVPYANDKIGPGAPPVKTPEGWLVIFHAVDIDPNRGKNGWEPFWKKRYCAGIMLLDLEDPSKVIGVYKEPLMAPEADYEVSGGFRNHVIFPGGMILEDNGEVKIYYGAADTVECLATAHVDDLIRLCKGV